MAGEAAGEAVTVEVGDTGEAVGTEAAVGTAEVMGVGHAEVAVAAILALMRGNDHWLAPETCARRSST